MAKESLTEKLRSNLTYIKCGVLFTPAGIVRPVWIEWEGERYEVEYVYGVSQEMTPYSPAPFLQYDCRIDGRKRQLYYDGVGRFFIEREAGHVS